MKSAVKAAAGPALSMVNARRQTLQALTLGSVVLLSGCATARKEPAAVDKERSSWTGRLGLTIASDPPQSFSAGFSLSGNAETGQLSLSSPLGSTLAAMHWQPGSAVLNQGGKEQRFNSLDELVTQTSGTPIPIRALFAWLRGEPETVEGWQADLSSLPDGRLHAQRLQPLPTAELRLVFD
ncbi:lipoprotein insertase outer membrane protein LolB [Ottowia thiooxydans]|uniref:Outer-membrane lipoprotein LolB n=1 Tax=Ottowia thiooxydans TaxID=219182 RepID=A0ABV2Q595_9BURK